MPDREAQACRDHGSSISGYPPWVVEANFSVGPAEEMIPWRLSPDDRRLHGVASET